MSDTNANTTEKDNERLNADKLLEFVREVSSHSEREVARVARIYRLAALGISVIIAVGVYWTYKDASEMRRVAEVFRREARDEIVEQRKSIREEIVRQEKQMQVRQETLFSQMQTQLGQQVTELGAKVEKKVDEEFKAENINKLVSNKAQERIDKIADPLINDKITKQIIPKIEESIEKVEGVEVEIEAARRTLRNMQVTADYLDVVNSAKNDDRQAFDQLKSWASDSKFIKHQDAIRAFWSIVDTFETPIIITFTGQWEIEPSKLSYELLRNTYITSIAGKPYEYRLRLVQYLWARKDFSKKQKMALLIEVMKNDTSLRVVAEASRLFQDESKQKIKRLLVDYMYEWWEKNKDTINDKPEDNIGGGK